MGNEEVEESEGRRRKRVVDAQREGGGREQKEDGVSVVANCPSQ